MRPHLNAIVFFFTLASVTAAADLAKIERTIIKEPVYRTKPRYCLLVFGPEEKKRVWLIQDGDTLYIDRNGNGDLTEPGEKVVADKRKDRGPDDGNYTFAAGELHEGGKRHLNLSLSVRDVSRSGLVEAEALRKRDPQAQIYAVSVEVEIAGYQGLGEGGRLVQGAYLDSKGLLQFTDRPRDAPIIHFGGPWTLGLYHQTSLWLERSNNMELMFGTPGLGAGSFAYVGYEGVVPENIAPRIEIRFPPRKAGAPPVVARYELKERC